MPQYSCTSKIKKQITEITVKTFANNPNFAHIITNLKDKYNL